MTRSSFPTPQHDSDASAIRVDEPSAGGRVAGPTRGCPVDNGKIDGRRLLGVPDPAAVADPYPRYARLRAADPVHRTPDGLWILTRHGDVAAVLRDPRFGREGFERHFGASGPSTANDDGLARAACPTTGGPRQSMLFHDPPHHARLRDAVSRAFTPRAVEALRPRVQSILSTLPLRFSIQEGPEGRTCRRGEGSGEVCDRFERSTT